jgi:PAS domain S-box-containing protein
MALLENDGGTLRFLGVNKAFVDFFSKIGTHISEESLLGRDYGPLIMRSGFFMTDKENEYREFVHDILTRDNAISCIQQVKLGGRDHYLDIYYKPVRDASGFTRQVIVSAKEITELVEANEKLREREHLLDSINRNMKDGIYRSAVDDRLIYHNKAMYEMFGYTEADAVNLHPSEYYVHSSDRQAIIETLSKEGKVENREVLFKRKNGETFWGMINATMRFDSQGERVIDGIVIDISNLKEFQEELKTNNEALTKTNSELDHLVYRTSHDLRAPIASLLGLTELIKMELSGGATGEYLGMMEEQLHKLDGIIMDIINYRKIAKTGLQYSRLDLQTLIHDVLNGMKFTETYYKIKKSIKGNWEVSFCSDLHNVSIILNNLLSNAIKYSDPNKTEPRFDLLVNIDAHCAKITLSDNGIGIDREYQERVFDMFFRATVERSGTGLGLFIVKEAVDKLQGTIEMKSTFGEGTEFILTLPNKMEILKEA